VPCSQLALLLQALLELLPEVQRLVSSLPPDTLTWRLQVLQEGCRWGPREQPTGGGNSAVVLMWHMHSSTTPRIMHSAPGMLLACDTCTCGTIPEPLADPKRPTCLNLKHMLMTGSLTLACPCTRSYVDGVVHSVEQRTMIVAGGLDLLMPSVAEGGRLARRLPRAFCSSLPRRSHLLLCEPGFDLLDHMSKEGFYMTERRWVGPAGRGGGDASLLAAMPSVPA
jgi:hypothetical protein